MNLFLSNEQENVRILFYFIFLYSFFQNKNKNVKCWCIRQTHPVQPAEQNSSEAQYEKCPETGVRLGQGRKASG
jgi:hypothetical protein